jgi:hypothetical protein
MSEIPPLSEGTAQVSPAVSCNFFNSARPRRRRFGGVFLPLCNQPNLRMEELWHCLQNHVPKFTGSNTMTLTLRERVTRRSIPFQTLAVLASVGNSTIYATEVSKWASGKEKIPSAKAARLMNMLVQIETMLDGVMIRPDLRDAAVVRAALEAFEKYKTKQIEIMPAPFAVSKPVWPARSERGVRPSNAVSLLAEQ